MKDRRGNVTRLRGGRCSAECDPAGRRLEGVPYVKAWKLVLTKRAIATVLYLIIALAAAGIVVLLGKL